MTCDVVKINATTGQKLFRVGNFDLRLLRSCQQAREHLGLSHRELELLMWVGAGLKKREIANQMGVTPSTADTFRRRAYAKLGVSTGAAAVAIVSTFLAGSDVATGAGQPQIS